MISGNTIIEKIESLHHLPSLPQLILKLIEACNDDSVESRELSRIISTDASLTSKLMIIAGSACKGVHLDVDSVETAVVYLGTATIKNIAMSALVMKVFGDSGKESGINLNEFWWHSIMCGTLSRKLAVRAGYMNPDEAFLAGLVHDTGKLVFWENFPEQYGELAGSCTGDKELAAAEKEAFGLSHNDLTALLVNRWGVNPLVADAVKYLGEPAERIVDSLQLVKITYAAHLLAQKSTDRAPHAALLDIIGLSGNEADELVAGVLEEVLEMALSMGIIPPDSEGPEPGDDLSDKMVAEVKNSSLLYGTISTLLAAGGRDEVLELAEQGIHVLFNVSRVFFFFLDGGQKVLRGWSAGDDRQDLLVKRLTVPYETGKNLIARSLREDAVKDSFSDKGQAVISDEQIVRLLAIEGMVCLPMRAGGRPVGVIALGINRHQLQDLSENASLLKTFARQVGTCIYADTLRDKKNAELQGEKFKAMATATGKIVHEINNPLGIVRNYVKILSMKLPENHPVQEELTVIGEEMKRVSLIVKRFSDFSEPGVGQLEPVDINSLFSGVFEILKKSMLTPRGIEATLKTDPAVPLMMTDKNALKQVIINLVKNSAESMDRGGRIDIITRHPASSGTVVVGDKMKIQSVVEVIVRDNGVGIPPHIMEKLFEPWNTSKSGSNSGLGLSIVHSIVKGLKGSITCDSREGAGTEFKIVLPV